MIGLTFFLQLSLPGNDSCIISACLLKRAKYGMDFNLSPGVSTGRLVTGPVPTPLTAATDTVYCVDGISPEVVACLASTLTLDVTFTTPSEVSAVTV